MRSIEKAQVAREKTREPPTELTIAERAETLHQAARDVLLGSSTPKQRRMQHHERKGGNTMTVNRLNKKTAAIMQAIQRAGKPLKCSEIADLTGLHYTGVGKHIRWNMLNKWVKVEAEEINPSNCHIIKYYGLTPFGVAKLEDDHVY